MDEIEDKFEKFRPRFITPGLWTKLVAQISATAVEPWLKRVDELNAKIAELEK
jgi:hypothetical protein